MPTEQTVEPAPRALAPAASRPKTDLAITGMTCSNCARHVGEALQSVAGVFSATVNLDAGRASVRWASPAAQDVGAAIKAVEEEGYGAKALEAQCGDQCEHKLAGWQINLWVGLPATAVLMVGEWVFGLAMVRWFQWVSFALASMVQVFAGARFYRGAWSQLKAGSSNMDTLVALGSTTAFGYSAWALLSGHGSHVYFMEAAAIITLISVGHWLESRVSVRASSALRKLLNLAPALARRRNPEGAESEVPVADLKTGDLVALRPGDSVPTDGEVVEGESVVDESMLTGESVPVEKAAGRALYAGTANVNGRLLMRVTATGEETALAHIIQAVQRAQSSRANIQRLGDRVSSVFVPVVAAIALAAGLWWGVMPDSAARVHAWLAPYLWHAPQLESSLAAAFIIASAVLIISCPCAMGLATPAAIMAGSNAAAQRGILIRDGVALEKAGSVTVVLFDKTGTLTEGRPEVAAVWEATEEGRNPNREGQGGPHAAELSVAVLAAALARHSAHPISQAVARLSSEDPGISDWVEVRGAGVEGRLREELGDRRQEAGEIRNPECPGHCAGVGEPTALSIQPHVSHPALRLGSLRWLNDSGVALGPGQPFVEEWSQQGATIVGFAAREQLLGLFAVKDTLKPGARAVVDQLRRQAFKVFMVTGDNQLTAASIAAQAGIPPEAVFADIRPEQKSELVKKLQSQGERVAFVGDGINDAPALEQADLGIAVSRASDIAREAADLILLKSELEAVPEGLGLARAALRTIKQNLFWAFFYNAIGIPLAALGFMSPILCAAAMGLSDLVVIGNALRLRRWTLRN